ncbi:MAG: hypothetical protein MMC33_002266 [Icmadophila ericetorum]|nr:hypothetical protein [Icmadophila ericetorum]
MHERSTSSEGSGGGGELLWYFAYGSNMSSAKFTGSRGIAPLATARVRVPGWVLALNIPGLPYSEPTFTSITPRTPSGSKLSATLSNATVSANSGSSEIESDAIIPELELGPDFGLEIPDIIGVAYLITASQYIKVLGSEGGGIAYEDIEVDAVPLDETDREQTGPRLKVRTLGAAIERYPPPKPSKRYMDIITLGASEASLPLSYQSYLLSLPVYTPPQTPRGRLGAAIFLSVWGPVMELMEKITKATIREEDGYAPLMVIWLVRFAMWAIWVSHDLVFARVWGRGDGGEGEGEGAEGSRGDGRVTEKSGLLGGEKGVFYIV